MVVRAPDEYTATTDERRRAVVLGGDDVTRTIGRPGLLERAGATEVVREQPSRFDVLLQRIHSADVAIPADLPPSLQDWFRTMVSTEAVADDVTLVVLSLRHELLGPEPWRHRSSGLLLEPPEDFDNEWTSEEIGWMHAHCEPAGRLDATASIEAMRSAVDVLHQSGRMVLIQTVSTYDPNDTTFSYVGIDDTFALRAHRLIAEVQRLALEGELGFVDVDTAIAELGAAQHVSAPGEFTDEAATFITEEAIFAFDQAALFGSSVQPAVMRLVVPPYDRRTERGRGRIQHWHVGPGTKIARGDELFEAMFEDLPLRIDQDDLHKRRPTTGRRQTRRRTLSFTVVAASDGYLSDIVVSDGERVGVGDVVAVVTPTQPEHAPSADAAEGDFRVAVRRGTAGLAAGDGGDAS